MYEPILTILAALCLGLPIGRSLKLNANGIGLLCMGINIALALIIK